MHNRARSLIYSTGLPPAAVAAATAGLNLIAAGGELVARPLGKARLFTSQLNVAPAQSAIVPVIAGAPERAMAASRALEAEGFLVAAIRPPTVPENTARLRFTFTAEHTDSDIRRLARCVRDIGLAI